MASLILASISTCIIKPPKIHYPHHPTSQKVKLKKQNHLYEFSDGGVVSMCRNCWLGDGDNKRLELEVLEFMNNSSNPNGFPSKRELIEGGRIDLVEAIKKSGGWMLMDWDDNEVKNTEHGLDWNLGFDCESVENSVPVDISSSNNHSIDVAKEDSGIEGILNRLTRERNQSFGLNLGNNGSSNHVSREEKKRDKTSTDVDSGSNSHKGDAWRTWSLQRAGVLDREFEADEIEVPTRLGSIIRDASNAHKPLTKTTKSNSLTQRFYTKSDVKARLELLKMELSSVIRSLGSSNDGLSEKASRYISEDCRQVSDASEFQENELMRAQETLRSMRAKLGVLERKMAHAVSDAQEILNEKQKRIDDAHRALQLLRTTCIVWPNSGSEVLLSGSFDGWSTHKRMERSSNGVFSLSLKLYPGKYEIKFIVDGSWKVDSLRPVVNHGGYENNLLIVS